MRTVKISNEALAILSGCKVEQLKLSTSLVKIVSGQLERKLYTDVNKVLEEIGGKWSRSAKGHVFETSVDVTRERLDGVILSGEIAPLKKNGCFWTPPALAATVAALARLRQGQRILEPNGGSGALVDAILDTLGTPHISTTIRVLEINESLAVQLRDKYIVDQPTVIVDQTDFLTWTCEAPEYLYDRIVMNPPFENRADAKHVLHAWSLLKPGGWLVAIMSAGAGFRREDEYQQIRLLISRYGSIEKLPEGSFKESGTGVNTVLVILDKPEDWKV